MIATLEPKPGRDYGDGDVRYVTPDVYIQKVGDELVVTLNDEGLPRLRVSQFYRRVLGQGGIVGGQGYIQDKMRAAAWLIKSIHQRQRTLFMVTHSIIKFQREFFEHGVSHLKPLVLKDVANDIGMHESTVSRATANKYAHTPQGIYELKYFFTSSLRRCRRRGRVGRERTEEDQRDHRQRGSREPVQRSVDRREIGEGQHRHCAPHGGEVSRAHGNPAVVQAPAVRLSPVDEGSWGGSMRINVTFRHMEATDALQRARREARSAGREVRASADRCARHPVGREAAPHRGGRAQCRTATTMTAKEETGDLYSAIDLASDKLEHRARKHDGEDQQPQGLPPVAAGSGRDARGGRVPEPRDAPGLSMDVLRADTLRAAQRVRRSSTASVFR